MMKILNPQNIFFKNSYWNIYLKRIDVRRFYPPTNNNRKDDDDLHSQEKSREKKTSLQEKAESLEAMNLFPNI